MVGSMGPRQGTATSFGTCLVYSYGNQDGPSFTPGEVAPVQVLDAGPSIALTGPAGTVQLDRSESGDYEREGLGGGLPGEQVLPPFLVPGDYTADNGAGGADARL